MQIVIAHARYHVTCTPYAKFGYIIEFPTHTLPTHYDTFIGLRWRKRVPYLRLLEILGLKDNWVTTSTFLGHVTSSVMWPFDSPYPISYSTSIVTKALSLTAFEILGSKVHVLVLIQYIVYIVWQTNRQTNCNTSPAPASAGEVIMSVPDLVV